MRRKAQVAAPAARSPFADDAVETLDGGSQRGYSDALRLYVCWEDEQLRLFDARTESHLHTHDEEPTQGMAAEARVAELEAERRRIGLFPLSPTVIWTRSFARKSPLMVDATKVGFVASLKWVCVTVTPIS